MISEKDINKPAIVYVRETATGKLLWRNFGYRVAQILNNGYVLLIAKDKPDIYFKIKDVRVIDE